MFVEAIEEAGKFTRPVHTIIRQLNETQPLPGAATLFFVNDQGVAITCRHVMELLGKRVAINSHYENFKAEKAAIGKNNKYNQRIKQLEEKYQYGADTIVQLKELFVGIGTGKNFSFRYINHPLYDLSIVFFENMETQLYQSHAVFLKDGNSLKQGKFLCRLGYPFPEFTNYRYNDKADDIEWTGDGIIETPRFPIEGMLTRHLMHSSTIYGIEMSTPGLRGQSGGPVFNEKGIVCGMQSGTHHLHLGFDMKNLEIKTGGKTIRVTNQPFLNVGHCIHVDIIKQFLRENQVLFYEE